MDHFFKSDVGPDHLAGIIKDCMRKLKFSKELFLDLTILRSKAHELIHDDGLGVEIHV